MNHDEEQWERKFKRYKIAQKCPRCNKVELKFAENRLICSNCGFEQK